VPCIGQESEMKSTEKRLKYIGKTAGIAFRKTSAFDEFWRWWCLKALALVVPESTGLV